MLEVIGLVILTVWISKRAKERNKNPFKWGTISVGLYIAFYLGSLLIVGKGFVKIFDRPTDLTVATLIFSWGLIGISFAFSSFTTMKLMNRRSV
jgi:fluoride ion exporter CrcB/FEX